MRVFVHVCVCCVVLCFKMCSSIRIANRVSTHVAYEQFGYAKVALKIANRSRSIRWLKLAPTPRKKQMHINKYINVI